MDVGWAGLRAGAGRLYQEVIVITQMRCRWLGILCWQEDGEGQVGPGAI